MPDALWAGEEEKDGWHFVLGLFTHGQETVTRAAPCRIVAAAAVLPGMGHE